MSIDASINDRLLSDGGKNVTHANQGDVIKGTIVGAAYVQARDFASKEPKVWDDGSPVMQLVITLQTEARDDAEDDGIRKRYCKPAEEKLLGAELRRLKVKLEVGGTFASQWTGTEPVPNKPSMNRNTYKVQYAPPVAQPVISGDSLI